MRANVEKCSHPERGDQRRQTKSVESYGAILRVLKRKLPLGKGGGVDFPVRLGRKERDTKRSRKTPPVARKTV